MAGSGSKTRDPRDTPAMRQYARFKREHPDCVLFFRMGDFYEMFDDDAVLVHRALGLTLTQRSEGVPMAGVPYHSVEGYLRRMIEQGHRVAVCEQVQDPKEAKGVVDRAVTRVLTPGTLVDDTLLDDGAANEVTAVAVEGDVAALATVELSTGSFEVTTVSADRAVDEIARIAPSEVLYDDDDTPQQLVDAIRALDDIALTPRAGWSFGRGDAAALLRDHYGVNSLAGFGWDDDEPALGPAGALIRYLHETQAIDDAERLAHVSPPRRRSSEGVLAIDATSLRSLEIERTMRSGGTEGSLLAVLPTPRTSMGRRLVRRWLCFPLGDRTSIEARQAVVTHLVADTAFANDLAEQLAGIQDVARIVGRIAMRRATPRDLVALASSAARVRTIADLVAERPALAEYHARLARLAHDLEPLADELTTACVEEPPAHMREGGLIRDGIDATLDEARGLKNDAKAWLAEYQAQLIERTGIPSLKVGFNKVFGYYIEITNAHRDKAPPDLIRKQTLKNAERYVTDELRTFEEKVTTADSRAIEREKQLFADLCQRAAEVSTSISAFADVVAELDALGTFALTAIRHGYVMPAIEDAPVLEIVQGRHPVLDRMIGDGFVPNDCTLKVAAAAGEESDAVTPGADLALITGPNMAGKSTYIRQVALIVLLAHTGCPVPAEAANVGVTDRIFTRIGASDELHAGQSTFMVEMTETANILHHATQRSLVILDEIGRGTSTLDGLSLAWAIAETLANARVRTLFATHYHELTSLADRFDNVTNLQVAVREWGDEIVFLHRILPGRTDRSYGIHVARIAGLPSATIDRAQQLLETLSVEHGDAAAASAAPAAPSQSQLGLFTEYLPHPALEKLREVRLDSMSPLEAFDTLRALHDESTGDTA